MPHEAPLVEVDASTLTRAEWTRIVWGVLWRGASYTFPPLLIILIAVGVFGLIVGVIALKAGLSPQTIQEYDFVFEIVGDIFSAAVGIYTFARSLRTLSRLRLGPYRFALVRIDEPDPRP